MIFSSRKKNFILDFTGIGLKNYIIKYIEIKENLKLYLNLFFELNFLFKE